jgi:hypothetical protein
MEERERERRFLEDFLEQRLQAERNVILDVLAGVIVKERKSVGADLGEEIRQLRIEVGELNAAIEELRRDTRRAQHDARPPAPRHELN